MEGGLTNLSTVTGLIDVIYQSWLIYLFITLCPPTPGNFLPTSLHMPTVLEQNGVLNTVNFKKKINNYQQLFQF